MSAVCSSSICSACAPDPVVRTAKPGPLQVPAEQLADLPLVLDDENRASAQGLHIPSTSTTSSLHQRSRSSRVLDLRRTR